MTITGFVTAEFIPQAEGRCILVDHAIEGKPAVFIRGVSAHGLVCKKHLKQALELAKSDEDGE